MNINIPSYGVYALEKLNNAGFSAYIVGGFIRDSILGIPSYDIDITTNATVFDIKKVFSENKIIETGIRFSSLSVIIENKEIQITSFRKDGKYSDNRHPDEIFSALDLKEDLIRRDFSINCLAYSLNDGIIDYFNSLEDLHNKTLKSIQSPKERFKEDPIRILRGVRFAIKLGFHIESDTLHQMRENAYLLSKISAERIYKETYKILLLDNIDKAILEYYDILSAVFPFLIAMKEFNQDTPYHNHTLLKHTAFVLKNSNNDITSRLSALFHDVGKLYTKSYDENNIAHFYNHHDVSENYAKQFLKGKGISNKIINDVALIIKNHNDKIHYTKPNIKLLLNRLGENLFFTFIDFKIADDKSKTANTKYNLEKYQNIKNLAKNIINSNECYKLSQLEIKGTDLQILDISKTDIKIILNRILFLVINEKLENNKNDILDYLKYEYDLK